MSPSINGLWQKYNGGLRVIIMVMLQMRHKDWKNPAIHLSYLPFKIMFYFLSWTQPLKLMALPQNRLTSSKWFCKRANGYLPHLCDPPQKKTIHIHLRLDLAKTKPNSHWLNTCISVTPHNPTVCPTRAKKTSTRTAYRCLNKWHTN